MLADMPGRDGSRHGYGELLPRSVQLEVHGVGVRVAALDDIIASKEFADRPKDQRRSRNSGRSLADRSSWSR